MLKIPPEYNRNASNVQQLGEPEVTGKWLLEYMAERLGVMDLSQIDVLDYGCGCRFASSIVNLGVPVRTYTGIDLFKPMVDFLNAEVEDPRLQFHAVSFENELYNPEGEKLTEASILPVGGRKYDVACMFSVITHTNPADSKAIFSILRRIIRPNGRLFFSVSLSDEVDEFGENFPDQPGTLTLYNPRLIEQLLSESGWQVIDWAPRTPRGLPILESFLCAPAS